MVHPRRRSPSFWGDHRAVIALVAAAFISLPAQAMAQSTDLSANGISTDRCNLPLPALPAQIAISPLGNVEPAASPWSASNVETTSGGQFSRLDQMRLAQAGRSSVSITAPAVAIAPTGLPQTARNACSQTSALLLRPTSATTIAVPENAILGSMSIAIESTPFDQKWSAVNAKRGSTKVARLLGTTGAPRVSGLAAQVEAVNRWVNRNIEFGEDRDIYGRADYWATASETLQRGAGDCEDFAIAKMELLSALGIKRDKMRLVVARDLVRNADHAVLVVTLADRWVMLDNMTDRLLDAQQANDYRPIMSFSQNGKWLHGYTDPPTPPVRMATNDNIDRPSVKKPGNVWTLVTPRPSPIFSLTLLSVRSAFPTWIFARV
ncbi:MAG: transglutaminase-like cysteine peptidase [Sphingobium sp.]|nr:MAG: transglutaminase-like cysteine peptidase [Sphingobium sp.]